MTEEFLRTSLEMTTCVNVTDLKKTHPSEFVDPINLIRTIQQLESLFPGWWWSISQMVGTTTVSLGPDLSASIFHRSFMNTEIGDAGFVAECSKAPPLTRLWTAHQNASYEANKALDEYRVDRSKLIKGSEPLRSNTHAQTLIGETYRSITDVIPEGEIREIYLGSCWRSADCSIRLNDGRDYTVDLSDPWATIDQCITKALEAYKEDKYARQF